MKMRRKGFLAALLGLVAAPVLAKVTSEPKQHKPCRSAVWLGRCVGVELWFIPGEHQSGQFYIWVAKGHARRETYRRGEWDKHPTIMAREAHRRAVAKGLLKPKFPRYFASLQWQKCPGLLYARADSRSRVSTVWRDEEAPMPTLRLDALESAVEKGLWREISADEAQALLNPKGKAKTNFPRYFAFLDALPDRVAFWRADGPRCVCVVYADGTEGQPFADYTLNHLLTATQNPSMGEFREIPADEAKALLKHKPHEHPGRFGDTDGCAITFNRNGLLYFSQRRQRWEYL